MARPAGICFEASTVGLLGRSSHVHIIYSLLPLHSPVRMAEQKQAGAGQGHAKALEHPWQARLECLP